MSKFTAIIMLLGAKHWMVTLSQNPPNRKRIEGQMVTVTDGMQIFSKSVTGSYDAPDVEAVTKVRANAKPVASKPKPQPPEGEK